MFRLLALIMPLFIYGCAATQEYNPVQVATQQVFLLNQDGLNKVRLGMTQDQVHQIMGQKIAIGYSYPQSELKESDQPQPITIANPYKIKDITTDKGACTAEYYVTAVRHPDDVISDDELMPLVFCGGVLTSKGGQQK